MGIAGKLKPRGTTDKLAKSSKNEMLLYSNGSINNNMTLAFLSGSAPNGSQIANVLINIAPIIPDFNIDTNSITVNGTSSSGVSHKISLATAPCLVLLSWLLTNHQ
ncbi:hypothetical protein Q8A73_012904 [Channa argus]|nr:hypothetical protein Q8A73_012904 [Channa argus]